MKDASGCFILFDSLPCELISGCCIDKGKVCAKLCSAPVVKLSGVPWSMNGFMGASVTTWMYSSFRCGDFLVCLDSIRCRKWGVNSGGVDSSLGSISMSTGGVNISIGRNVFEGNLDLIWGIMSAGKIEIVL